MEIKNITKSFLLAAAAGGIALSAHAQLHVSEDWESGNANNWTNFNATKGEFRTGDGPSGSGDTHVFYDPGGTAFVADNTPLWGASTFSLIPTDANPVVLSGDIWYDGVGGKRVTIGLRHGAWASGDPMLELGFHNGSGNNGLGIRALSIGGNSPGWAEAVSYTTLGSDQRWITVTATMTATDLDVVFVDTLNGGFGTATLSYSGAGGYANAFDSLRIGGPSTLSSAGGGLGYDNITLETIPEPSTYAAIFGGLALLGAFVYRRRLSVKK